jgi:hypothetical protein
MIRLNAERRRVRRVPASRPSSASRIKRRCVAASMPSAVRTATAVITTARVASSPLPGADRPPMTSYNATNQNDGIQRSMGSAATARRSPPRREPSPGRKSSCCKSTATKRICTMRANRSADRRPARLSHVPCSATSEKNTNTPAPAVATKCAAAPRRPLDAPPYRPTSPQHQRHEAHRGHAQCHEDQPIDEQRLGHHLGVGSKRRVLDGEPGRQQHAR